jgi:cytochrome c553
MRRLLANLLWLPVGMMISAAGGSGDDAESSSQGSSSLGSSLVRWLLMLAVLLAVLGAGGFLVAASGAIPIKASSGHWAITKWFLNFSMRRSVKTHSVGIEVPPLDDRLLVLKGAGHFETGCQPCHGSPAMNQPVIAAELTPQPPSLSEKAPDWEPEELFYIVKHGVKFTGMPAWPARERDDEVWAMVAFLRELPKLDAGEYLRLATGRAGESTEAAPLESLTEPDDTPGAILQSCVRCHGAQGLGRGEGAFPILAGQKAAYLKDSLAAYASGERPSGIMQPVAAGLDPRAIDRLARYYADLEPQPRSTGELDAGAIGRGEQIAREGIPDREVPACMGCHGPAEEAKNPHYPLLAGQYPEYLTLQLRLFKSGIRGGGEFAHLMRPVAQHLTEEEIADVAAYYASLEREAATQAKDAE